MSDNLTPAEALAVRIIDSLEPVLYDSMGSALYCHQLGRDTATKAVADAARIVAKRVDEGQE